MPEDTTQPTNQVPDPVVPAPNPYFSAAPSQSPVAQTSAQPSLSADQGTVSSTVTLPSAPRRSKKKLFIIAGIVALTLLVGSAVAWFFVAGPGGNSSLSSEFLKNSAYVYNKSIENADPKRVFSFKHSLKASDGKEYLSQDDLKGAVQVYSDASLTKLASARISESKGEITVNPSSYLDAYDSVARDSIRISNDGEWGLHDQYYIVQFVNLKNGEKLEKPIVTPFSTKKEIQTPVVSFNPDANGNAHLRWTAVEGATSYYIVKLSNSFASNTIIGQTDGTEWTAAEEDLEGFLQNREFNKRDYPDDALLDPTTKTDAEKELLISEQSDYGVIAVSDERFSSLSSLDVDTMQAQLPYRVASNLNKEINPDLANKLYIDSYDKIPEHIPITMADGTTTLRSVILDTENTAAYQGIFVGGMGRISTARIPYTVQGTSLTGYFNVYPFNEGNYKAETARIAQRNVEAQSKTGEIAARAIPERPNLDNITASTTKPNVPYKINASNPMTEFIAANMLNGEKFIDVSAFITPSNPILPKDAYNEAVSQNPYILLHASGTYTYVSDLRIFVIDYDQERDSMMAEQKKMDEEVKRVVASVVKPGMSDREKVKALNDYVVDRTVYNYTAYQRIDDPSSVRQFRNSWTPSGVLFDKSAVCGGYAEAFKVLADAAGLESVYVTGTVNGNGHAWNKVKVDGKWRIVDTTWNDTGEKSNDKWLLITEEEADKLRVNQEDKDWMADALIPSYATK